MRLGGYKLNEQRIREHFAFLPITIKGYTRWLENVKYVEEWYCPEYKYRGVKLKFIDEGK